MTYSGCLFATTKWVCVCAWMALAVGSARAGILDVVGAMGDSLTDESWSVEPSLPGGEGYINWIEHLDNSGKVSFGPQGSFPVPRRNGYERNYAMGRSTTDDLLSNGQHTGLAGHDPTLAYLGIGGNDFAFHMVAHASRALGDGEDPIVMLPQMKANFRAALETVAGTVDNPTGTAMILATVPDLGRTPAISYMDSIGQLHPNSLALYRNAAAQFNAEVKAIGAERGFPVLDLFGLFDAVKGPIEDPCDTFTLAGVDLWLGSYTSDPSPTNAFVSDWFHPGTVIQGIMANMFIEALNRGYDMDIPLFSDQEILATAGIEPGTPPGVTTHFDVSPYVIVPEPGVATLLLAGMTFGALRRRLS